MSSPDAVTTDVKTGLLPEEAAQRLRQEGPNQLKSEPPLSHARLFLQQFKSPMVLTLLGATAVSGALGHGFDAAAIVAIVLLNAVIGYVQEAKAEAAVAALQALTAPHARVLRGGHIREIAASEVCRGDVLILEAGDYIAADARLVEAHQVTVDEALLTGESIPSSKSTTPSRPGAALGDRHDMIFGGTLMATGSARAVVAAIGMGTEIGKIAGLLQATPKRATPLQRRLEEVSRTLLWLCLTVVGVVVLLGLWRGHQTLQVLVTGISLAVAAIPEGLPAVVTLSLALAVRRMVKHKAIVRNLLAVETLGSIEVICTDKTGTLTTGQMRVREVALKGSAVEEVAAMSAETRARYEGLVRAAVLCSNASLNDKGQATGDPTEVALLYLSEALLGTPRIENPPERLAEWSFDSHRKRMSVAVQEVDGIWMYCKGAPESLLPLCHLSPEERKAFDHDLHALSSKGRRLLVIARRKLESDPRPTPGGSPAHAADVERDFELLGVTSIADPPRPESKAAIKACQAAGIRVVMITGDHPVTARAIATELGILGPGQAEGLLAGPELETLSTQALKDRVASIAVYARVAPDQKLKIVEAWKSLGTAVAMTGDGVNDAPALKAADIGISMGLAGTEVARQASGMVLADDHFATIVHAVKEGRAVYGNIRRTVQYLVSVNLAEILIMLGASLMGWPTPLFAIHLLWINLVTDGLPALALAAEPVPEGILESRSAPSPRQMFNRHFYREILVVGLMLTVLALGLYGYGLRSGSESLARTYVFAFLVFAELFRSFASRSETKTFLQLGARSNLYHLMAVGIPMVLQAVILNGSWFEGIFRIQTLHWHDGFLLAGLTLIPVTVLEIRKWFRQRGSSV